MTTEKTQRVGIVQSIKNTKEATEEKIKKFVREDIGAGTKPQGKGASHELPSIIIDSEQLFETCIKIYDESVSRITQSERKTFQFMGLTTFFFAAAGACLFTVAQTFLLKLIFIAALLGTGWVLFRSAKAWDASKKSFASIHDIYAFEYEHPIENFSKKKMARNYLQHSIKNDELFAEMAGVLKSGRNLLGAVLLGAIILSGVVVLFTAGSPNGTNLTFRFPAAGQTTQTPAGTTDEVKAYFEKNNELILQLQTAIGLTNDMFKGLNREIIKNQSRMDGLEIRMRGLGGSQLEELEARLNYLEAVQDPNLEQKYEVVQNGGNSTGSSGVVIRRGEDGIIRI